MRIEIRGREVGVTAALTEHVERRLRFALGRFATKVRRATVRLSDANGPRGGVDKLCRIAVTMPRFQPMVIEDTASDLYAAIDRASDRASRVVERQLSRSRNRHPVPALDTGEAA